jgi:hypothetical protein
VRAGFQLEFLQETSPHCAQNQSFVEVGSALAFRSNSCASAIEMLSARTSFRTTGGDSGFVVNAARDFLDGVTEAVFLLGRMVVDRIFPHVIRRQKRKPANSSKAGKCIR